MNWCWPSQASAHRCGVVLLARLHPGSLLTVQAQQNPAGSVLMQGGASVRAWKTHCRAGLWRGLPGFHAPWSHAVHQLPCLRGPLLLSGPVLKVSASVTLHA